MAAILNGHRDHGSGLIPYGGTFLVLRRLHVGPCASRPFFRIGVITCSPTIRSASAKTAPPTSR